MLFFYYKNTLKHELRHALVFMALSDICDPEQEFEEHDYSHNNLPLIPHSRYIYEKSIEELNSWFIIAKELLEKNRNRELQKPDIEKLNKIKAELQNYSPKVYAKKIAGNLNSLDQKSIKNPTLILKIITGINFNKSYVMKMGKYEFIIKALIKLANSDDWVLLSHRCDNCPDNIFLAFLLDLQFLLNARVKAYEKQAIDELKIADENAKINFLLHELNGMLSEIGSETLSQALPRAKELIDQVFKTSNCTAFIKK
jgi:hypothetical protein